MSTLQGVKTSFDFYLNAIAQVLPKSPGIMGPGEQSEQKGHLLRGSGSDTQSIGS